MLSAYIEPIVMYRCETLSINKSSQDKHAAGKMCFIREMLGVSLTEKTGIRHGSSRVKEGTQESSETKDKQASGDV